MKKELLEKIYLKIVSLDFDQLSFQNHIIVNEVINHIKKLRQEESENIPPPLPKDLPHRSEDNNSFDNVIPLNRSSKTQDKLRIMVIDEDIDIQSLVEYSLRNESEIELIKEHSPVHALQLIPKLKPEIILIDINMQSITCHEFIKILKTLDPENDIEIIIGSHHPNNYEKSAALEMGAYDYISKPYDLIELSFKLKMRVEKKKKELRKGHSHAK